MKILCFITLVGAFSLFPLTSVCAGNTPSDSGDSSYITGTLKTDATISIFDGLHLNGVNRPAGKFRLLNPVTEGLMGVVFITRQGSYPEVISFKAGAAVALGDKSLDEMCGADIGVLIGVVYKPVTGGKLKPHNGIGLLFKNERIVVSKGTISYQLDTDANGIFMKELPSGEYDIFFNGKNTGRVVIEQGLTTIKNLQKGIRLVD